MSAQTYSFTNVLCSLMGPNGIILLGNGAGVADEGITIDPSEDVATMTTGADGQVMYSVHAARPARATVRLLKTSPANALLSALFALETSNPSQYGQDTIVVTDIARVDICTCLFTGFTKFPGVTWAKDANFNEWGFHVGKYAPALGAGI